MPDDEYIPVEAAAVLLGVTTRQVNRYGSGNAAKLRTERAGRRILYHRGDVLALADTLGDQRRLAPLPTHADLIPASEMLDYLRDRDEREAELNKRINELERENGELRGQLRALLSATPDPAPPVADYHPWWRFWTRSRRS